MNDPTRYVSDLTAPDAYTYRVQLKADDIYAEAVLVKDSTARDGRYRLEQHTGRTATTKGSMGARQQARAAQLLEEAVATMMEIIGRAGWRVEERDWCGRKVACYYQPEPYDRDAVLEERRRLDEAQDYDDQVVDVLVVDLLTLEAGAAAVPQVAPALELGNLKARKGWYAVPLAEAIAVAEPPCELIYPLDPTPAAIAELGAQCRRCGRVHDVMGRITGDVIWCPCGCQHTVRFPARVVKGGQ